MRGVCEAALVVAGCLASPAIMTGTEASCVGAHALELYCLGQSWAAAPLPGSVTPLKLKNLSGPPLACM